MRNNNNDKNNKFSKKSYFSNAEEDSTNMAKAEDRDNKKEKKKSISIESNIGFNNDILDIFKTLSSLENNEDGEESTILIKEEEDHECPIFEIYHQKILGITWNEDKLEKFLKARGYTISEITVDGETYKHGAKDGVDTKDYDLYEIFEEEIQDIVLDFLLNLGNKK